MKENLGLNPWLSIWMHPRKTIRALIEYDTNYRLVIFCAIYGLWWLFLFVAGFFFQKNTPLMLVVLFFLIFSIPIGYVAFNVVSALYFWAGKLLKGKGSFKQIRAAICWSQVPIVLFVIGMIFLHGIPFVISDGLQTLQPFITVWGFVMMAWSFIIMLHALGEVQGFSVWMALLNVFLPKLVIAFITFIFLCFACLL